MNPIRFIEPHTLLFDFEGNCHMPQRMTDSTNRFYTNEVMISVSETKNPQRALDDATAFALRYLTEPIMAELQLSYRMTSDYGLGFPIEKGNSLLKKLYDKLCEDYPPADTAFGDNAPVNADDVRAAIEAEAKKITAERYIELCNDDVPLSAVNMALLGRRAEASRKRPHDITQAFCQMPVWAQLILHDHGAYVCTFSVDKNSNSGAVMTSEGLSPILGMYIGPDLSGNDLLVTMREELLHMIQHYHDNGVWNFNRVGSRYRRTAPVDVQRDWEEAAIKLFYEIIEADFAHPALEQIEKSEFGGGSLLSLDIPMCEDGDIKRANELLVDVFEAEIQLQYGSSFVWAGTALPEQRSLVDTANALRSIFGDTIYTLSRKYLDAWMTQAQEILGDHVGEDRAREHRARWEAAPFTHVNMIRNICSLQIGTSSSLPDY